MKKFSNLLLLFILSVQLSNTYAQGDFAPIGATWHYSWSASANLEKDIGYILYESVGDTTIQGQVCRNIKGTLFIKENRPSAEVDTLDYPGLYVYSNPDTVFYYDADWERFQPLYIFNLNVGDTAYYTAPGWYTGASEELIFRMRVTDITHNEVDGIMSKTIHHEALDFMGFGYNWNSPINEKIGTMGDGLLLAMIAAVVPEYHSPRIRCYRDQEVFYQRYPDIPCDLIESTSNISEVTDSGHGIEIYPNPVITTLHVKSAKASLSHVALFDVSGRRVKEKFVEGTTELEVDIAGLTKGLYLLEVNFGDGFSRTQRVQVW